MRTLFGFVIGVIVIAFVITSIVGLLWWLFVIAAVVAVVGFVWRAVTQH
jgi:hypothetical protein